MPAKFEASALFEFLGRVDRELAARSIIFLIGGSAVSIIDPAHSTSDLDLLSPGSREFDAAVARLRARGEPVLPVQVVGIVEAPEGRLVVRAYTCLEPILTSMRGRFRMAAAPFRHLLQKRGQPAPGTGRADRSGSLLASAARTRHSHSRGLLLDLVG